MTDDQPKFVTLKSRRETNPDTDLTIGLGETKTIGRGRDADWIISDDSLLSRVHFAVACQKEACLLNDLSSSNGTFVNGRPVSQARLENGDVVTAGNAEFDVAIGTADTTQEPGNEGRPATPLDVGDTWHCGAIPDGWELMEPAGFRQTGADAFPRTVVLNNDTLADDESLDGYVAKQIEILQSLLKELRITAAEDSAALAADECRQIYLRHQGDGGKVVVQQQFYLKRHLTVGIVTLTASESDFSAARPFFERILSGLEFTAAGV